MIELTVQGSNEPALVDDCWASLAQYKWKLDKNGYPHRKTKGARIYLHHVVLPGNRYPNFVRDHINRNKLDSRSENLRWITLAENAQNRGACKRNRTGVRGVRFDRSKNQYLARVQHKGKAIARQWFDTLEDATRYLERVRPAILPLCGHG